jgi:hypothetical protein
MPAPITIPARITVVHLDDPVTERIGFAPESGYVEWVLLPRVGPAGIVLYRHLAALIRTADRAVVDLAQLARKPRTARQPQPQRPDGQVATAP